MNHARTPDLQDLTQRRHLADSLGMPARCPHKACRRARRCAGPRGTAEVFPGAALPACLARGFDALHRPVAEWNELMASIREAAARIDAVEERAGKG